MKRAIDRYFLSAYEASSFVVRNLAHALLYYMLIGFGILYGVLAFVALFTPRNTVITGCIVAIVSLFILVSLTLLRRGRYRAAANIITFVVAVSLLGGLYARSIGNPHSVFTTNFYLLFVVIVQATLFCRRSYVIVLSGAIIVSVLVFYFLLHPQFAPRYQDAIRIGSVYITLGVVLVTFLSQLSITVFRAAFLAVETELAKNRELTDTLERKVVERTQDIQAAMDELSQMNDSLAAANQALRDAEVTMNRDLDMAINVQQSFLPRDAPSTRGYDIAFAYIPMAGVSGDFYDFYMNDGSLDGLALFDVSGHGIASGLVTMIAKSVVFRCFNRNRGIDLGSILDEINHDLIEEIGKVDHYLTGVLLRMRDGHVEYVNAGHPDILLRRATGGGFVTVGDANDEYRTLFLGIEMPRLPFSSLIVPLFTEDIIVLYSDGLIECSDRGSDRYGMKRLVANLDALPLHSGARDVLDGIMEDLERHRSGCPLSDDLTVIVVKRTGPGLPNGNHG